MINRLLHSNQNVMIDLNIMKRKSTSITVNNTTITVPYLISQDGGVESILESFWEYITLIILIDS